MTPPPTRRRHAPARTASRRATTAGRTDLEARLDERFGFERLAARSRVMLRVLDQARQLAASRVPVLIEGEVGTGKGTLAAALHHNGPRRAAPFVRVACDAPAGDLERALFGSASPGDAVRGGVERADGGTLFLDHVEATPPAAQIQLLRALQEGAGERAGVRVIAAGTDLAARVAGGSFREDLLQRLGVVRIAMPPLRERLEDLPALVGQLVAELNRAHGRRVAGVTPGVMDRLRRPPWPGNVRELRDVLEAMVIPAAGRRTLDLSDLPARLRDPADGQESIQLAVGMTVAEAERRLILATLRQVGNDKARAAAMLGIGLRTLYRKLKAFGIG
jgi:two-component system response regulator HydG